MTRTQNEGLAPAPDFTPHRVNVVAADAVAPFTGILKTHGMVSEGCESVAAQATITGATTSVTLEILLWSDRDGKFVHQEPAQTFGALTASRVVKFTPGGQRFFIHISGTIDAAGRVDVACAALAPPTFQQA